MKDENQPCQYLWHSTTVYENINLTWNHDPLNSFGWSCAPAKYMYISLNAYIQGNKWHILDFFKGKLGHAVTVKKNKNKTKQKNTNKQTNKQQTNKNGTNSCWITKVKGLYCWIRDLRELPAIWKRLLKLLTRNRSVEDNEKILRIHLSFKQMK
jgi:hypothetical protein